MQACYRVSERRGRMVLRFDRKSHRYRSKRDDQAFLRHRIREIAAARVRFGHRRIHLTLRREGVVVNHTGAGQRAKIRRLPATDAADAERQRAERAVRGETGPVRFVITGVPRYPAVVRRLSTSRSRLAPPPRVEAVTQRECRRERGEPGDVLPLHGHGNLIQFFEIVAIFLATSRKGCINQWLHDK